MDTGAQGPSPGLWGRTWGRTGDHYHQVNGNQGAAIWKELGRRPAPEEGKNHKGKVELRLPLSHVRGTRSRTPQVCSPSADSGTPHTIALCYRMHLPHKENNK